MARLEELTQELDMDSKSETENLDVKLEEKQNTRIKSKGNIRTAVKIVTFLYEAEREEHAV